jgi:hypothetical protein
MAYTNSLIPIMTSNTTSLEGFPSGVASVSSESSSTFSAWKAMDSTSYVAGSSYWSTTSAGVTPCWITFRFENMYYSKAITKYTIASQDTANTAPKDFVLQGSNDNLSWTDLNTQTGQVFAANEQKSYTFSNTTKYLYHRLYITANNGGTTTRITLFEIMAESAPYAEISGINLQAEVDTTNPYASISGLVLQAEFDTGAPIAQLSGIVLQVEVAEVTTLNISQHIPKIEILQYTQSNEILSVPDISTMVLVNDHNLKPGDFFVNKTVRDLYAEYGTERGSRRVLITPDTDEIGYNVDIADAQAGDEIWQFSFIDVTQYLMRASLSITKKANNSNTASFRFKLPIANDLLSFYPHPGQYVRISLDDELYFIGLISDVDLVGVNDGVDVAFQNISCIGLKAIPARRTVSINYSQAKLAGTIVQELVDDILVQEGFLAFDSTYIADGLYLGKPWSNDCITISDILDELATRNGFQWFVDDDIRMHFYQDPATFEDAPYNLEQDGILKFRDLSVKHSIENYINKVFVIGGKDINGDQIKTSNINLVQQNNIQYKCGGSGIYGGIIRDGAIADALYRPAEAGTAFFTIKITNHNMSVGDYLYNETLGRAFWVVSIVDANTFTVNQTIYDQAPGDSIATFPSADHAGLTMLRNQAYMPKTVEYTIDHIFMKPQTKQVIDLPRYGVSGETYNIESVTIKERGAGLFESRIVATLKNPDDYTTQPHPTYVEYYRGL